MPLSQTVSATPKQKQQMSGLDRLSSHGLRLFEYYYWYGLILKHNI
ncbi:hypothetical protein BN903_110 [Halorubrum sp. AJ67]|nr:hypothetical protein BN903_110 [Halorubrum sp. AJ67]